ncbi:hypothetical protein VTN77DRAFT_4896 [Rasamsonia byssochlamydoides]|uniref:uncharacterized protein n=1 Tax=Rasamsonia byssochlamydoides TaxID=89139 RepID=UPI003742D71E
MEKARKEAYDSEHGAPDLTTADGAEQGDAKTELQNATPRNVDKAFHSFFSAQDLENCDWEQLQERFSAAMEEHARVERDLQEQTTQLLKIFMTWSRITISRDEDRSFKRFKTRMQHVQNSELQLEEKRKHYINVVRAFESALALLK